MATLPDGARIEAGRGGLRRLTLEAPCAEAQVYLHGANVTHFQPRGEKPVLWVSERSLFEGGAPGKPIRGGVPICFPWFGPRPDAPLHGVARLFEWNLVEVAPEGEGLRAVLAFEANELTRRHVAEDFALRLAVTVRSALTLELEVVNRSGVPFRFEEALHTYFAVGDVRTASVCGLEGRAYLDKTEGGTRRTLAEEPLRFAGETDRVFPDLEGTLLVDDPAWKRRIEISRVGSRTAVVWNPWAAKAQAMPDFGDEEWTGMLCVEAANALDDAVTLPPGATHTLSTRIALGR